MIIMAHSPENKQHKLDVNSVCPNSQISNNTLIGKSQVRPFRNKKEKTTILGTLLNGSRVTVAYGQRLVCFFPYVYGYNFMVNVVMYVLPEKKCLISPLA